MAAQEYYTGTPPNTHLPSAFSNPQPSQSQPFLSPNNIPPRRGSSNPPAPPSMAQVQQQYPRPGRGSFGQGGSQPPPFSRQPQHYNGQQPPYLAPGPYTPPPQPRYSQQQIYNPNLPPSQLPQPYPNYAIPSTHRPNKPPRRPSESSASSSDSESYHSDPENHRRRHHHNHSRPRSARKDSSKSPRPRYRTARHNSDAWLGGIGGGLIGDIIFPGLGTVGGALAGALQGHHYDVKREAKEDRMQEIRKERRRRRSSEENAARGRERH